jgi:hypothetical protein
MKNTDDLNILPSELVKHHVYFMISFLDHDLLIAEVDALVYLGHDYFEEGDDFYYFEDFQQYSEIRALNGKPDGAEERQVIRVDSKLRDIFTATGVAKVFLDISSKS